MSEEILDEQTTTDEIEEQDNSTDEPIDEIDNSDSEEPEDDETAESDDEEHVEDKETLEIPEMLKDVPLEEIKKFFGKDKVDLSSTATIRAIKTAYHAQQEMREAKNKVAELDKVKEQEAVKAEEQQIAQLDETVKQNYDYQVTQNNINKSKDLKMLKDAYENGTGVTWFDGQVYDVNDSNYDQMKEIVIEMRLNEKIQLDQMKYQANQQVNSKKTEKQQKDTERFFTEYESGIKEKLESSPELTEVFNFIKKEAIPNKAFVDSAFTIVENAINKAAERIATQRLEKAENNKATSKAGGAVNNSSPSASKEKAGNLTVDDILGMSDDEVAKL